MQTEPRREGAHTGTRRSRAHRRLRRAALAALALTLAAAGWFAWSLWLTRSPPSPELTRAERTAIPRDALDPSDLGGDLLAIAPPQEDERSRHAPATTRVLPALDTPLVDALDALRDATAQGSSAAACRLALSLSGCARIDEHRRTAAQGDERLVERLAGARNGNLQTEDEQVAYFLRRQENANHWIAYCEGMPAVSREHVVAAMRIGSEIGDAASTQRYLQFMMHSGGPYLLAHPTEAAQHRESARRAVARMLRERDPSLLPWMAVMASPHISPLFDDLLPEVFRDPDIGTLVYRIASSEAADLPVQFPRGEPPSPETLARAEQAYRDHFKRADDHQAALQRMKQTQQPAYIDLDMFDRLEDCSGP
ncbi:MAG: hypothetical protein KDJ14_03125 [Xanthomonadales bacterium]|nr:hypothetical protein [Xanthomonadales bacterium]